MYIKMNGQQAYNEMLAGLVSRMTWIGKEEVHEMNTSVSVGFSILLEQLADDTIKGNNE